MRLLRPLRAVNETRDRLPLKGSLRVGTRCTEPRGFGASETEFGDSLHPKVMVEQDPERAAAK